MHYLIARGLIGGPRARLGPFRRAGRWSGWRERFDDLCRRHPAQATPMLAVSAVAGVPPFGLTVIAAGMTRLPLRLLLPVGAAGRLVRYCVLAALPQLVHGWW